MKNRKGFTLIELLAVVVILGVIMVITIPAVSRWIDKGKTESLESQKKTTMIAAQSYAQANPDVLPKTIGEVKIIPLKDLKNSNYLKEDIKDAEKNNCMEHSFVRIYKYNQNGYSYSIHLYCGNSVPMDGDIEGVKPKITIGFIGNANDSGVNQSVGVSSFKAVIDGNKLNGKPLGVDGYHYTISVKREGESQPVEVFNSGDLNGGGKDKIVIEKSLSDYISLTNLTSFIVTVEAYNRDGGYMKKTANSSYDDSTPPVCGKITGQAGENEWANDRTPRTIKVECSDGDGSGCVRSEFSKTFDEQTNTSVITIYDNAGNHTDCPVRVHIDWTKPTLTVVAYVRTSNGGKGAEVGRVTASEGNSPVTLSTYSNTVGGWLNYSNYPYGLYYEFQANDNILLGTGQLSYNSAGIYDSGASNFLTMKKGEVTTFSNTVTTAHDYFEADGLRRGYYDLKDKAGNTVRVNLELNIDRTNPSCSTTKSNLNTTAGVNVSITCSDGESQCSSSNTTYYTGITQTYNYSIYDNAGNTGSCSATVYVQPQASTRSWNSCASYTTTCVADWGWREYMGPGIIAWDKCVNKCDFACNCANDLYEANPGAINSCICPIWDTCAYTTSSCVGAWGPWSSYYNVSSCSNSDSCTCRYLYY